MRPGPPLLAALAALLLLDGCPLPQSVPSVPAGSIPPPRIVDEVAAPSAPSATVTTAPGNVLFDPGCATNQFFTLTATVADENYSEPVGYRWFANYAATSQQQWTPLPPSPGILDPPTAEPFTRRAVPSQILYPAAGYTTPVVVELVISNGFDVCPPDPAKPQPLPCRTPQTTPSSYEVQSHKWVFVPVPGCATAGTCIPCPP